MKKKNVLVRGASGLLAQRLISVMKLVPSINIFGIYKYDPTLVRMLEIWNIKNGMPDFVFLDENERIIEKVCKEFGVNFDSVEMFDISGIDIVVDTTPMTKQFSLYQHFKGPIIMQDGMYPKGKLISLPKDGKRFGDGDHRFRQGGCILSGIVPILYILEDLIEKVEMKILMQEDERGNDYLISERLTSVRHDDGACEQISEELTILFPSFDSGLFSITKVPGLINYQVEFFFTFKKKLSKEDFVELIHNSGLKRVQILNSNIKSGYTLNLARSMPGAESIPPIHIFSSLYKNLGERTVSVTASLYHRTLPILANLDSIFHLGFGLNPLKAMERTDELMKF